jgi:hypothetical protein
VLGTEQGSSRELPASKSDVSVPPIATTIPPGGAVTPMV